MTEIYFQMNKTNSKINKNRIKSAKKPVHGDNTKKHRNLFSEPGTIRTLPAFVLINCPLVLHTDEQNCWGMVCHISRFYTIVFCTHVNTCSL